MTKSNLRKVYFNLRFQRDRALMTREASHGGRGKKLANHILTTHRGGGGEGGKKGERRGKRQRANRLRKDSKAVNPQSPPCTQQFSSS